MTPDSKDQNANAVLRAILKRWIKRLRRWLAFICLVVITWAFIGIGVLIGWKVRGSDDMLEMRTEIQSNRAAIDRNRAEIMLHASPVELTAIQSACPSPGASAPILSNSTVLNLPPAARGVK